METKGGTFYDNSHKVISEKSGNFILLTDLPQSARNSGDLGRENMQFFGGRRSGRERRYAAKVISVGTELIFSFSGIL